MDTVIFEESQFEQDGLKVFAGLASPYEKAGDSIFTYFSSKLSSLCVLDGVSSSASPSESSLLCKDRLQEFFKSKRAFKIDEYKDCLEVLNKEMLAHSYASTLSQVVFTENHMIAFTIGDSQVFLYDEAGNLIYESWPQNVGFSNSKSNAEGNVILNWVGNDHLRFELVQFEKTEVKFGLIVSDGVLDFLDVKQVPLKDLKTILKESYHETSSKNLLDDSSFVFFEL